MLYYTALFYGFSPSFSLSFRLLYFARPKHAFSFAFFEVFNLSKTSDFHRNRAHAGYGFRVQKRQEY